MPDKTFFMSQFFISYARADGRELAEKLKSDITRLSSAHHVFFDTESLSVASFWEREIQNAVNNCDYFIVLFSPSALLSDWVKREVEMVQASEQKTGLRKLIVVCTPGVSLPGYVCADRQALSLSDNWAIDFYRLMSAIDKQQSFFFVEESVEVSGNQYDVILKLKATDPEMENLIDSVEYRFDHGFIQSGLTFQKVLLKKSRHKHFAISFWTDQTIIVFVVVYLKNTKQIPIIHKVIIG